MPTITAIETQQHDPERISVFLDGKFGFGASTLLAYAHNLVPGRELTAEEIEALRHDEAVDRAFGAALNFLSFRPRSRREIEDYCRRKKIEPEITAAVVERLQRTGLIDDREFGRFWIENRQTFRPRGTRALKAEMRQKGLDAETIESVLEAVGDEEETAYNAGRKKAQSLGAADEAEFFRKMLGFLQRRGFPYAAAASAAKRLYREVAGGEPEEVDLP